jgi:hypothetical protein
MGLLCCFCYPYGPLIAYSIGFKKTLKDTVSEVIDINYGSCLKITTVEKETSERGHSVLL